MPGSVPGCAWVGRRRLVLGALLAGSVLLLTARVAHGTAFAASGAPDGPADSPAGLCPSPAAAGADRPDDRAPAAAAAPSGPGDAASAAFTCGAGLEGWRPAAEPRAASAATPASRGIPEPVTIVAVVMALCLIAAWVLSRHDQHRRQD